MKLSKHRKRAERENLYCKVYVHNKTGNIRVIYPTAPKWAQRAAMLIFEDVVYRGVPTKKGVKDMVKGTWAKMIAVEAKHR